jgi:hypothetical protein
MHPLLKKYISECLKISKKYLNMHLDILCSFMKFRERRKLFVAYAKKTNFGALKLLFT